MAHQITGEGLFLLRRVHFNWIRSLSEAASPHTHRFFEIFVVTGGRMLHEVNGERMAVEKGIAVLIRPADLHGFFSDHGSDCSFLNIAFPEEVLEEVCAFLGGRLSPGYYRRLSSCLTAHIPNWLAEHALQSYRELCLLPPDGRKADVQGKLLIAELLEACFLPQEAAGNAPEWLEKLEEAMRRPEVFSGGLPELSRISGRSPEHICRSFRKYRGISPHEFLSKMRAVYAANLLITTSMPVLDICMECGYASLSHFYSRFRAAYGMTPAMYRERYQTI